MAETNRNHNRHVAERITAILLAGGLVGAVPVIEVRQLLTTLRPPLSAETAVWLTDLAGGADASETLPVDAGPCQDIEAQNASAWLALYLVTAASRLIAAIDKSPEAFAAARAAEERYFELHLRAERRRMRSAAAQDAMAQLTSDRTETTGLLGWRAVLDERTTPACAWAHGQNFKADEMPVIGWPGAVHMRCRCSAGPAIPGAPLLPSA